MSGTVYSWRDYQRNRTSWKQLPVHAMLSAIISGFYSDLVQDMSHRAFQFSLELVLSRFVKAFSELMVAIPNQIRYLL